MSESKNSGNSIRIVAITLLSIFLLFVAFIVIKQYISPALSYNKAVECMETGNYEEAISRFRGLYGYRNANELVNEAEYQFAIELRKEHNYYDSYYKFLSLGAYKDSGSQAEKTAEEQKKHIKSLLDAGKYDAAQNEYTLLLDHSVENLNEKDFVFTVSENGKRYSEDTIKGMSNYREGYWYVYYDASTDMEPKENVVITHRKVNLGDSKLEVLLAYGNAPYEGHYSDNSKLYKYLKSNSSIKKHMENECITYMSYYMDGYYLNFYFDKNDEVSFIACSKNFRITDMA